MNPGRASRPCEPRGRRCVIDGVMYFTIPDHVWAVDARTGRERWHYGWTSKGGIHLGNRGAAVAGDSLYFETPDCNLVSLNIKDGTERWRQTDLRSGSVLLRDRSRRSSHESCVSSA